MTDFNNELSRTMIGLMHTRKSAFFISLCLSLKHVCSEEVPTAATDGETVYYNPKSFMSLTPNQRIFLMLHETMHCALLHMHRMQLLNMNHQKANVAADHVVNLMLIAAGFEMPPMGLADPQYEGMSMEQVYKLLPDSAGKPDYDDLMPAKGTSSDPKAKAEHIKAKADAAKQKMDRILIRAAMASKAARDKPGSIPGQLAIYIEELLNPKLPWQTILRKYLNSFSKDDYSWSRPNKRFMPKHYLPSMHSESLIDLAIAVDISGSVTDEEFSQFIGDITSIFRMMKPKKITLLHFDTKIHEINELKSLQDIKNVKFTGRGGTDIAPVYDWVNKNKPQLMLVFTDGYFYMPEVKPTKETLFLIHNNPKFETNHGRVIHYEI